MPNRVLPGHTRELEGAQRANGLARTGSVTEAPERSIALVVPDASTWPAASLVLLSLLARLRRNDVPLLQAVLIGDPALEQHMATLCGTALAGQVDLPDGWSGPAHPAAHLPIRIPALTPPQSQEYLAHRFVAAGGSLERTISPAAVVDILGACDGNPGRIDRLADACLALAAGRRRHYVTSAMVRVARARATSHRWLPLPVAATFAISTAAAAALVVAAGLALVPHYGTPALVEATIPGDADQQVRATALDPPVAAPARLASLDELVMPGSASSLSGTRMSSDPSIAVELMSSPSPPRVAGTEALEPAPAVSMADTPAFQAALIATRIATSTMDGSEPTTLLAAVPMPPPPSGITARIGSGERLVLAAAPTAICVAQFPEVPVVVAPALPDLATTPTVPRISEPAAAPRTINLVSTTSMPSRLFALTQGSHRGALPHGSRLPADRPPPAPAVPQVRTQLTIVRDNPQGQMQSPVPYFCSSILPQNGAEEAYARQVCGS